MDDEFLIRPDRITAKPQVFEGTFVPEDLVAQLKPGGRLVIPVGEGDVQRMLCIDRKLDGTLEQRDLGAFRFVPMLGNTAK